MADSDSLRSFIRRTQSHAVGGNMAVVGGGGSADTPPEETCMGKIAKLESMLIHAADSLSTITQIVGMQNLIGRTLVALRDIAQLHKQNIRDAVCVRCSRPSPVDEKAMPEYEPGERSPSDKSSERSPSDKPSERSPSDKMDKSSKDTLAKYEEDVIGNTVTSFTSEVAGVKLGGTIQIFGSSETDTVSVVLGGVLHDAGIYARSS